jgi:signal transduction histidine kinase/CheY-like chemotaxis protein
MVKKILNTFKDGVYISNLNYNIEYLNDSMKHRIGFDALGSKCYYAIYNNSEPCENCYIPELLSKKSLSFQKKIEDEFFIVNASMLDESKKITVYNNISEIKFYEKQLEEQNSELLNVKTRYEKLNHELENAIIKAEENDRLKTSFLANMSHEIRTPMNAILGFSDLLKSMDLAQNKREEYFEIINANGNRLMNIINEIVDISKIDAKELKLQPDIFSLNNLIDQLQQQFLISPRSNNTEIVVKKALSDDESYLNCDETRLGQVLSNLLENALKFTPNGLIEMGYSLKGNQLHFYVKDNGAGIHPKDHMRIFERFGQSENNSLNIKEGSGLGLAICKGIIELMGGKIWVESEINKGSTFYFTKPYCSAGFHELKIEELKVHVELDNNVRNILIAEDEESNYLYLEALLEPYDFKLIHVENGKEAVEIMQNNNSIDLILMDFNMPIMNGIDATKEIRKTNKDIPIIAITAYAMAEDKQKAIEVGCNEYISKPIKKDNLLELINKLILSNII